MEKKYKINRSCNAGTVIFILEGQKTEFDVLEFIFVKILNYQMIELRRFGGENYIYKGGNSNSRVIGLNLTSNFLYGINDAELNNLFYKLSKDLRIKPENAWIFYLYDRDVLSYDGKFDIRAQGLEKYRQPLGGNADGSQGQLLLSYPSIESYVISCCRSLDGIPSFKLGKDLKTYAAQHNCQRQMLRTEDQVISAAVEMDTMFTRLGCGAYDLDNLTSALLKVHDAEDNLLLSKDAFALLSLISIALLEIGILVEEEKA